jgi:hypothetical protein
VLAAEPIEGAQTAVTMRTVSYHYERSGRIEGRRIRCDSNEHNNGYMSMARYVVRTSEVNAND